MEVPPSIIQATPETNVPVGDGNSEMEKPVAKTTAPASGQQFQLETTRARIVVVCGACGSGKSYATRALLKRLFQQGVLKWIRIYSHTAAANHEYDWAPEGCVHPISLDAVSTYHKKLLKAREDQGGVELPQNAIIWDDSLGALKNPYDPRLTSLFATHRHSGTWLFYLSQTATGIPTTLRSLCDYALIFASRFHRERRHLFHFCGSWFAHEKEFLAVFEMATEGKHYSMVYINRQDSLAETYMSWRSDEIGDFRLDFPVV